MSSNQGLNLTKVRAVKNAYTSVQLHTKNMENMKNLKPRTWQMRERKSFYQFLKVISYSF